MSTPSTDTFPIALIPAYNPDASTLLPLLHDLSQHFMHIVLVDDGSDMACSGVFTAAAGMERVTVLRHHANLGKGVALRTGLNHIGVHFPDALGAVTLDADGQHLSADAARVAQSLVNTPQALVLGCRDFDACSPQRSQQCKTPWRSQVGNKLTRQVFHLITSLDISDTQSGLRGIPYAFIAPLLRLRTNGYDFELDMLLLARNSRRAIHTLPITTVYTDNNASSHFNPLLDSFKIYLVFLRFGIASVLTALIDFVVFSLLVLCGAELFWGICLARAVAGTFNFIVNRNMVFKYFHDTRMALIKYIACVGFMGLMSYALVQTLLGFGFQGVLLAKIFSETILFILSFLLQKNFVFGSWLTGEREHD